MTSITVNPDAVPEVIEVTDTQIVDTSSVSEVIVVTPSGPDTLLESTTDTEVIVTVHTEILTDHWTEATIIESAAQGPPGAQGPAGGVSYPGKTINYSGSLVSEVLSYLDTAKTMLAERRVLAYASGHLSSIQFFNGSGTLLKTRTLAYSGAALVSVTDV